MVIFFLAKLLANSSTVIGSNNASGPSSDIGRTETGCNSTNIPTTKSSLVKKASKIRVNTFSKSRTLANLLLSVNESSKPSSSCKHQNEASSEHIFESVIN